MIFFEFAKRSIRLHWLRSLLAVLGIVIGVMAISSMGILGNSLVLSVGEALSDVGDTVVVYPHAGGFGNGPPVQTDTVITGRQVQQIERAVGVNDVIPLHVSADRIEVGGEMGVVQVYGMDTADIPLLLEVTQGVYLRGASGALVGQMLAETYDLGVGSRITVGDQSLRVAGILTERGVGFDINPDRAVIVSDQWYRSVYGEADYDQVIVKVRNLEEIEEVKHDIDAALNRRETEVDIFDTRMILETILETFSTISTFTTAIGGISLVVAGVSIFNVQMMSVTERTREVGIIRSIGTRRREVMKMFLYEAFLLGFIGSAIGGILSFGGGYLALLVMLQDTTFLFAPSSLVYIPYGMLFGIGTSLISGVYPAWKAANLNPIEALRYE
ncbi:MAG: ABC transporter permease [Methanomicrobiaceae archaeon]|nr:ABC transporter permease [Methanomicrobiaceae archaeon]